MGLVGMSPGGRSVRWQGHDAASPSPRPHALEVFLFIKLAFRQGKCASFLPNGHDFHSYCPHTYMDQRQEHDDDPPMEELTTRWQSHDYVTAGCLLEQADCTL